jgi:hypothetical protein
MSGALDEISASLLLSEKHKAATTIPGRAGM